MRALRKSNRFIVIYFRYLRAERVSLRYQTFFMSSFTFPMSRSRFWKYYCTTQPLLRVISLMAFITSLTCWCRASVRQGNAFVPKWNQNSIIFCAEVDQRQCGSTQIRSQRLIFLFKAFSFSTASLTDRLNPTTNSSAYSQVQQLSCQFSVRRVCSRVSLLFLIRAMAVRSWKGVKLCKYFIYIMSRPENQLPPELWYNVAEASKYQSNTRIQNIQRQLGERAIELLNIEPGSFVLDIGCGSGISGETLQANEFVWEGIDISRDMLNIAAAKEDSQGGLWQVDIGQGWKFRPGVFDGAISVSTIQWLCVASRKNDNPFKRCCKFFQSLYDCLRIGGRAVLQFYPDGKRQLEMITTAAMKSGFSGGLIVDYPNSTRAKKYFLVLQAGVRRNLGIVESVGKTGEEMQEQEQVQDEGVDEVKVNKEKQVKKETFGRSKKKIVKRKQFVLKKKQRLRRRGLATRPDTKYTGRKRKPKF